MIRLCGELTSGYQYDYVGDSTKCVDCDADLHICDSACQGADQFGGKWDGLQPHHCVSPCCPTCDKHVILHIHIHCHNVNMPTLCFAFRLHLAMHVVFCCTQQNVASLQSFRFEPTKLIQAADMCGSQSSYTRVPDSPSAFVPYLRCSGTPDESLKSMTNKDASQSSSHNFNSSSIVHSYEVSARMKQLG